MSNWLWLDDERPSPGAGWARVYDGDEAIAWMIDYGTPEVASLDHDLAEDQYPWEGKQYGEYEGLCGFDVVKWMMANSVFPDKVIIHTMNPVGAARMIEELQRYRYRCTGFAKVPLANPYSHVMERDDYF
jgi:hypothetical protein